MRLDVPILQKQPWPIASCLSTTKPTFLNSYATIWKRRTTRYLRPRTDARRSRRALRVVPHLILLDVMMPEMDGIETCREIRSHDSLRRTLIAFLTARGEDYSQIAGFDAGADDYIAKPIHVRVLLSRIRAMLKRFDSTVRDADGAVVRRRDRSGAAIWSFARAVS